MNTTNTTLIIAAPVVQLITMLAIPLIVGLFTRYTLPSWVKGLGVYVLNAIAALITTAIAADGTALITDDMFFTWAVNTAISYAAYSGLYRPAGLTSSSSEGKLLPNFGIGR